MKKAKFFDFIKDDIPEKEWEANYLVQHNKNGANYLISLFGLLVAFIVSLILLVILTGTIQCSASMEFEGKGNIVLNETELPSTLEKFEFNEGKIKIAGTVPCSFLTSFGKYGAKENGFT